VALGPGSCQGRLTAESSDKVTGLGLGVMARTSSGRGLGMQTQDTTTLQRWGWDAGWQTACEHSGHQTAQLARVVGEQRGAHVLQTAQGIYLASPSGALRHSQASDPMAQHPAVGDWVVVRPQATPGPAARQQILAVLPRRTCVSRKVAGRAHKEQVVAANVDTVLIVCAFGGDINPRKIERFIAIARGGGAAPVVVLNKTDLAAPGDAEIVQVQAVAAQTPIHRICAHSGAGLIALAPYLQPGKTLVLLGSSGAGKSTLLNQWLGDTSQATGHVHRGGQGRHTTRSRTLVALKSGALVIDTPGVREIGMWETDDGVAATFSDIVALAQACRFRNCGHQGEPDCALQAALARGDVAADRVAAYRALTEELAVGAARRQSRRRSDGK
jgi:ribosome biogenesis GTPase